MNVGTKDLKNRLSHYLRLVREGEVVNVTDRGEVVAQLRPVRRARARSDEAVLAELARVGVVTRGRGAVRDLVPVRTRARGKPLSQMIVEDRG